MNKETDFDVLEINYSQLIGRWDIKNIDDRKERESRSKGLFK